MLIKKTKSNENRIQTEVKGPINPLNKLITVKINTLYDLQKQSNRSLDELSQGKTLQPVGAQIFARDSSNGRLLQNRICKLKITLYSYGKNHEKDLKHSLKQISKLFGRLSGLCAERLLDRLSPSPKSYAHLALYNLPGFNLWQDLGVASAAYCLGHLEDPHSVFKATLKSDLLAVYDKSQGRRKPGPSAPYYKPKVWTGPERVLRAKVYKVKTRVSPRSAHLRSDYRSRIFFKSCEYFSINSDTFGRSLQARAASLKLFTVTRAPFVFKKTREQFSLQKLSDSATINLYSPVQKQIFLECASLLSLPVEFKITDY